MNPSRNYLYALGVFLAGNLLCSFTKRSPTPEMAIDLRWSVPAFLVFAVFWTSLYKWGSFIAHRIGFRADFSTGVHTGLWARAGMLAIATGAFFYYLLAYILTSVGLFSSAQAPWLWMWVALPFSFSKSAGPELPRISISRFLSSFWLILVLLVLAKVLEGFQFHQHGDALITYLPAPRSWAERRNFSMFLEYRQFFLSTSWEALFAWGNALMGLQGGNGLDLSQWFAQWVTAGVAVPGILLAGISLSGGISRSFPLSPNLWPIVALCTLQVPVLRWMGNLAKNDLGAVFWGLAAFVTVVFGNSRSKGQTALIGALLGAMVVGKLSAYPISIGIFLYLLVKLRSDLPAFCLGGAVGALPVMIRNFVLTRNPFFPWLTSLFPAPDLRGSELAGAQAATRFGFSFTKLPEYLLEMTTQVPLWWLPLLLLMFRRHRKSTITLIWLPMISWAIFTVMVRPETEIRYQGPILAIFSGISIHLFLWLIDSLRFKGSRVLTVAISLALVVVANPTFFTFFQLGRQDKFGTWSRQAETATEVGGQPKLWIRRNLSPGETLLVMGDGYPFYLLDYPMMQYSRLPGFEDWIINHQAKDALAGLLHSNYPFLYINAESDYFPYRASILEIIDSTKSWPQDCLRFDGQGKGSRSQVWDLKCVRSKSVNQET